MRGPPYRQAKRPAPWETEPAAYGYGPQDRRSCLSLHCPSERKARCVVSCEGRVFVSEYPKGHPLHVGWYPGIPPVRHDD